MSLFLRQMHHVIRIVPTRRLTLAVLCGLLVIALISASKFAASLGLDVQSHLPLPSDAVDDSELRNSDPNGGSRSDGSSDDLPVLLLPSPGFDDRGSDARRNINKTRALVTLESRYRPATHLLKMEQKLKDLLAFPSVAANLLPLISVPMIFSTNVVREKPKSLFFAWPQRGDATKNLSSLMPLLKEIATISERVPPLYVSTSGRDEEIFKSDGSLSVRLDREYQTAFVFDGERCSTNMWHGMLEVVIPLFGAKTLLALRDLGMDMSKVVGGDAALLTMDLVDRVVDKLFEARDKREHVLLMRAPRKNIWGIHNLGCPILNHYPYGWSPKSVSGWLLYSLFDPVTFTSDKWPKGNGSHVAGAQNADDPHNMLFFYESLSGNKKYEMRIFGKKSAIGVKREVFYGPSSLCKWSQSFAMPPLTASPYYLVDNALCPFVYEVAKQFTLRQRNRKDDPVTIESLECPRIGIVVRRTFHNGRGIRNFDALVESLRLHTKEGGPLVEDGVAAPGKRLFRENCTVIKVLNLEGNVPFGLQIDLVNDVDILIGARGMGLTNALFMRRGAGLLVLSGREKQQPLNIPTDNYPWNPLLSVRPLNPTVLSSCPVVFPTPALIKKATLANHTALMTPLRHSSPSSSMPVASIQEVNTYNKRCLQRSVNFCDLRCSVADFLQDFDQLALMMRRRLMSSETKVGASLLPGGEGEATAASVGGYFAITDEW